MHYDKDYVIDLLNQMCVILIILDIYSFKFYHNTLDSHRIYSINYLTDR